MRALAVALAVSAAPAAVPPGPAAATVVVATFEHDLSTATGVLPVTWASLAHDRARAETYVVAEGLVRIFNDAGMEVHCFGDDGALGAIMRVAVLEDGAIVVLSALDGKRVLFRCDYRGELVARLALTGLPDGLSDFEPDQLVHRGGRLYLAERGTMRVVVTDTDGAYRQSFQLRALVEAARRGDADQRTGTSLDGFGVDPAGNLLFTMSTMFAAAVVTPSGELRLFGTRGSTPGRFNNVGAIDADEAGNLYVTDRLRSVVSVWSPELRHLGEFGYRGPGTSNLLTPYELAVGNGKVIVAQAGRRGVRVFRVRFDTPAPPAGADAGPRGDAGAAGAGR